MTRFTTILEWLNHSHQPPEKQAPVTAAALASFASFALLYALDSACLARLWWGFQMLCYASVPVLLAFIILYRSDWHRELSRAVRAAVVALFSCLLFPLMLLVAGLVLAGVVLLFTCYLDGFSRFHY